MESSYRDLQYYLLPARNPPPEFTAFHDQVFGFWMESWKSELRQLGVSDSHLHDDFIRQDVVSCLATSKKVVGILLFSFFSLETIASKTYRYFVENYPEEFFQRLAKLGIKSVMPSQYMAVHPDWCGKNKPPVPVSLMLAGLSNRVRDQFGIDAGIAPMRSDRRIASLFDPYGATRVIDNFISHNVPCDLVANIRGKTHSHPSSDIRIMENFLWENRIDLSLPLLNTQLKQAA